MPSTPHAGQPETTNPIPSAPTTLAEEVKEIVRSELNTFTQTLKEQYRQESVDRTLRDQEEKARWMAYYSNKQEESEEKRAKRDQASNRLLTNLLNQGQGNKQANSRELEDVADAVLGGQHALMDKLIAQHVSAFLDREILDERWEKVEAFMAEVKTFMDEQRKDTAAQQAFRDHVMSELLKITGTGKEDGPLLS